MSEFSNITQEQVSALIADNARLLGELNLRPTREPRLLPHIRFDGHSTGVREFLTAMRLAFTMQREALANETDRVSFFGMHLNGDAMTWFAAGLETGLFPSNDANALVTAFEQTFGGLDRAHHANLELEEVSQNGRPARDYVIHFMRLAAGSDYNESAKVNRLRRGLDYALRDRIANYSHATTLSSLQEQIFRADEAIRELTPLHHSRSLAIPPTTTRSYNYQPTLQTDSTHYAPMEIGSVHRGPLTTNERQRRLNGGLCLYCGSDKHRISNCPTRPPYQNRERISSKPMNSTNKESIREYYLRSVQVLSIASGSIVAAVELVVNGQIIKANALIDTGASDIFIDSLFVSRHNIPLHTLERTVTVRLIDGQQSSSGNITHQTHGIQLNIQKHSENAEFFVTRIERYDIVLGFTWLEIHNPTICFKSRNMILKCCNAIPQVIMCAASTNSIPPKYSNYADVFSKEKAEVLPMHNSHDCSIRFIDPNSKLPCRPGYKLTETERSELKKYIDENLSKGFIRESTSPAASPIFFVGKRDGSLRPVVDYRCLNELTIRNSAPLPLIDTLFDHLRNAKVFTKIDLRAAYNLIRIREGDEYKTAFRTPWGLFEYLVMPFGLANAPAVFQGMINEIFRDCLDLYVVVYLDDILIFSPNQISHDKHVTTVLKRLREHRLFAKLEKCEFDCESVEFLGFIVSATGISISPEKISAVNDWPVPTTQQQLQRFLGLANYCRDFIQDYSKIAKPLTDLTSAKVDFIWTKDTHQSFVLLKDSLITAPILRHANPSIAFYLEPDASDYAIGAVLMQLHNNKLHPVAYHSRKLLPAERNYATHDKELLAIIDSFKVWRHHLMGAHFKVTVLSDHSNLSFFHKRQILTQRHARWAQFLSEFNFVIEYRPGATNCRADALSRRYDYEPCENETIIPSSILKKEHFTIAMAVHSESNSFIDKPNITDKNNAIAMPDSDTTGIDISVIRIVTDKAEQLKILKGRHDAPTAGHFGERKTYELIARDFRWEGMRADVKSFVRTCDICQRTKSSRHKPTGLLRPLPIPSRPWTSLSVDLIVKLPLSNNYDSILVFVDRCTKMAHFLPCCESITASQLSDLFIKNIFRAHGLPNDIVSDRGPQFVSHFWREMLKQLGAKPNLSSAYHPQSDGQTERINQILEQYLRCYIDYNQTNWADLLHLAEFAYNNSEHTSTRMTPFFANNGLHPRVDSLTNSGMEPCSVPTVEEHLNVIKRAHKQLQVNLVKAQADYKMFADQNRQDHNFKVGDRVWLLRRNQQTSRPCEKLDYRRLGPFPIVKQINPVAFKLKLPITMRIHDVFHASQLEPYYASTIAGRNVQPRPPVIMDNCTEFEVNKILDSRLRYNKLEYLVDWVGYGIDERSWQGVSDLNNCPLLVKEFHNQFPDRPGPLTIIPTHQLRRRQRRGHTVMNRSAVMT